ncbi:MAG: hypothetical protein AAF585_11200 [Verrucomicrobiota bacterium]
MADLTDNFTGRGDLESYFETGDRPTQSEFTALIQSTLNQKNDLIAKFDDSPISIASLPQATSETRNILQLYPDFSGSNLSPVFSLNLAPSATQNQIDGLNIALSGGAATDTSCLFVGASGALAGKVGINTISPGAKLDVGGDVNIASGLTVQDGGVTISDGSPLLDVGAAHLLKVDGDGVTVASGLTVNGSQLQVNAGATVTGAVLTTQNGLSVEGNSGLSISSTGATLLDVGAGALAVPSGGPVSIASGLEITDNTASALSVTGGISVANGSASVETDGTGNFPGLNLGNIILSQISSGIQIGGNLAVSGDLEVSGSMPSMPVTIGGITITRIDWAVVTMSDSHGISSGNTYIGGGVSGVKFHAGGLTHGHVDQGDFTSLQFSGSLPTVYWATVANLHGSDNWEGSFNYAKSSYVTLESSGSNVNVYIFKEGQGGNDGDMISGPFTFVGLTLSPSTSLTS